MAFGDVIEGETEDGQEKPFAKFSDACFLMDYIDVIVHIFKKDFREIYELEELWADAEIINIQ